MFAFPRCSAWAGESEAATVPRTIQNKPRFESEKEIFRYLQERGRSDDEIADLVRAVQTGAAVAQALAEAGNAADAARVILGKRRRPRVLLMAAPPDKTLARLVADARRVTEFLVALDARSNDAALRAAARSVLRTRFPLKTRAVSSENMVMAVFAHRVAAHQRRPKLDPSEMDALVQLAGIRPPREELRADAMKRQQRTDIWKTTLARAKRLNIT